MRGRFHRSRFVLGLACLVAGPWVVACGPEGQDTPDPETLAPRCNGAPPDEPCPAGCVELEPWGASLSCGLDVKPRSERVCVAFSEDRPPEPNAAYYREVEPGKLRFLLHGQGCSELEGVPVGWTECVGAPDEPGECFCFERRGVNPWDEAKAALDACGLPEPCPMVETTNPPDDGDIIPDYSPARRCMFEAWRDGVDGLYRTKVIVEGVGDKPDRVTFYWDYVRDGEAITLARGPDDDPWTEACDIQPRYDSPFSCTLRDAAEFEACLTTDNLIEKEMCALKSIATTPCEFSVAPVCPGG